MIPFYIFYSMFGFQRTADLAWAAGDNRTRGFLIGATAGRTTLNGEGLQHQDGHSHLISSTVPNCVSYDAAYAYEIAVIVQDGLRRMIQEQEDVYYYVTVENENYVHPPMVDGAQEGILKGLHRVRSGGRSARAQLLGSGSILREVLAGADLLQDDFDRWNMLHPGKKPKVSWVEKRLSAKRGPVVAATDYMKALPDGIRPWVPTTYRALGTDGFGRSDHRKDLRRHFEIDRYQVVVATLSALAQDGEIDPSVVKDAIAAYEIDPDTPDPAVL